MLKQKRTWPSYEELFNLYWDRGLSLHQISRALGIDRKTLRRFMGKYSIRLRTPQEVLALLTMTSWITKDLLYELYWKQRLSQSRIAAKLGLSSGYVGRLMERRGVLRRPLSEAGQKYQKVSFSGNIVERSYMLGLRTGDLNATRSGFQVRLSTSTTHPALWILLNEIFGKYGRVGRSAAFSRGYYEWATYCYLDSSFEFLLDKCKVIPEEILADERLFLAFLAGYVDAEGSFRVYEVEGTVAVSLRINSEDEGILRDITRKLKSLGYHVDFALMARRGPHGKKRYRRDLWSFGMFRREEIVNLLQKLPLRHSEKRRAAGIILSITGPEWGRVEHSVGSLKSEILSEVYGFAKDAMNRYQANHRA